ncbi:MAG: alpha/beta hydrolase, partial [Deltaproteobacteria bacterium]|nr:alpha/beta hydrolase [Deltaproteobacteria bacterium]
HAHLCEEILYWVYSREFFEAQRQELEFTREKLKEMEDDYNIKGFQWKAEAGINADTTDRLDKIKSSTLVMAGELDCLVPPSLCEQQLVRKINGSRFVVMKGASHGFFDEKPEEVNKEIRAFLSSIE